MVILETETFRQAKKRLLSKREYLFIQRQILSPTRLVPTIRQSGGIRKLVWIGTIKGRRRRMQILYYYRMVVREKNPGLRAEERGAGLGLLDSSQSPIGIVGDSEADECEVMEQITLLHICQLRGSQGLTLEQVRRLRAAVRNELDKFK
ncbi:MAG: hypothetical protein ACQER4_06650 [Bacteroidota bacterium]